MPIWRPVVVVSVVATCPAGFKSPDPRFVVRLGWRRYSSPFDAKGVGVGVGVGVDGGVGADGVSGVDGVYEVCVGVGV